ncbi:NUMOD4 domain-containing protein [Paraburkholderia caballeronis]|uniref:NUMOD4 domain-containing protein n=1 Tax=Paraburkholderia caballeronis TaxID=416943 RepID=UPI0010DC774F|nr:NUMOD4 domain-containing protein [Paraburkholderia caballeronis]TDV06047.1 NUMOD4 motif-containing protein [Paraburkholderia caballeronis]TDV09587.1 NUMOD4 motif-containing protein [Paraburkholderia caballeronis]TDV21652.1 NUMOD4 motif-containing protein [Paraburkholderia caballeronis]
MSEQWRSVEGWPYEVSSEGRIRSTRTGRGLKPHLNSCGYLYVRLRRCGERKSFRLHRLIAIAFHGDRTDEGLIVAHNDGNPLHNRAKNLEWKTQSSNLFDKREHGTATCGSRSNFAKLSEVQVIEIRARREAGETYVSIGKAFGVIPNHVRKICVREIWQHV